MTSASAPAQPASTPATPAWRSWARLRVGTITLTSGVESLPATGEQHLRESAQKHLRVEPERPILDVIVVKPRAVCDGHVATEPADLSESRQPAGYAVTLAIARYLLAEPLDEQRPLRARPHQGHVTAQDVPELRQ